jgi:hypothetical protein
MSTASGTAEIDAIIQPTLIQNSAEHKRNWCSVCFISILTCFFWGRFLFCRVVFFFFWYRILLWALLTRLRPFQDASPVALVTYVVYEKKRPAMPPSWPALYRTLIERCWHPEPAARPAFPEIIEKLESRDFMQLLEQPIVFDTNHNNLTKTFSVAGEHLLDGDYPLENDTAWLSNPVQMPTEV